MLNKVQLIGRLGQDPEIRHTSSGDKIANFTLATSDKWKDKSTGEQREKTEWSRIVVFGKLADIVDSYVKKGSLVMVEGKLQTRKWTDSSGVDKYSTEVVLQGFDSKLIMLGGKGYDSTQHDTKTDCQAPNDDLDSDIPF